MPTKVVKPSQKKPQIKACLKCRLRKVKCNRQYPCSRCNESNDTCIYGENIMDSRMDDFGTPRHITPVGTDDREETGQLEVAPSISNHLEIERRKWAFVDWRKLVELSQQKAKDHFLKDAESTLIEYLRKDPSMLEIIEELRKLLPPLEICRRLIERYFSTLEEVSCIFDKTQIEKCIFDLENSNGIPETILVIFSAIISAVLSFSEPPIEAVNYLASIGKNSVNIRLEIDLKINEFLQDEEVNRLWKDNDRIRLHALRAQQVSRTDFRKLNNDVCNAVHIACFRNPIFQRMDSDTGSEAKLWLTICEIDALDCVLNSCPPWIQHDVYAISTPLKSNYSNESTYEFHCILDKLLVCGLEAYKTVHSLTSVEFIDVIPHFETKLSLILMDIESNSSSDDSSAIFRGLFLKVVFWVVRKNLYQYFIAVSPASVPNYEKLLQNLTQTLKQLTRIITNSINIFEEYGWLNCMLVQVVHSFFLLCICSDKGYSLQDDFFNSVSVIQAIIKRKKYSERLWKKMHDLLQVLTGGTVYHSELEDNTFEQNDETLFDMFADIFDSNFNLVVPSGL
ncbi:DNA-binding transcription factor, zf-fungal binuclear cluster type [Schizosaccharomyces osmophilus]|uniref:DNA-binding transcription factor, zf-fungal binuclear cluster type n=1 Tax=Schizosaccharomyces osmophilus TaxID=2545709 RepID=A0AAF0AYS8_9SCHI|nr:DNA-binding transcription factor, zf-fungal binuclear cluster type [Schizosaccharomyces osmophilus]WBW74839.1 DNA-binding transcription factor, zf-fungal binuclear cluster type [Schizosaccharomyces osmophilus]